VYEDYCRYPEMKEHLLLSAKFVHEFPGTQTKRPKTKHPEGQNFQRKKQPETKRPCYKMFLGTKHPEGHNILL
jgi:hypothetical protein